MKKTFSVEFRLGEKRLSSRRVGVEAVSVEI